MGFIQALKKNPARLTLILIFLVAIIIRFIHFNSLTFGYDQARDAFAAIRIFKDDPIKIQGPTTDIQGLFHGSLYWYLVAPFYKLSGGNPQAPRIFLLLLNTLNIFFIHFFSKKLFKKESVALVSAFLFAVSFEATQYARWLSNPTPALLSIALFYYGMWLTIQKRSSGVGLMLVGAAVSMQLQVFLVYLSMFFVFVLFYYLKQNRLSSIFTRTNTMLAIVAFIFYVPFVISEVKFRFQGSQALLEFFTKSGDEVKDPIFISNKLVRFYDSLVLNVSYNIFDFSRIIPQILLSGLVIFVIWNIWKKRKERSVFIFLFFWFLSPGLFYAFEKNNSYFLNIGNLYPLILLTSFAIHKVIELFSNRLKMYVTVLFLGLIVISNFYLISQNNKSGESLFSVQNNINLADEKRMIDWIYKESNGKPFVVNSVTNPLFVNSNWSYLFNWYGKGKYGYMPIWGGYPQVDVFGSEVAFSDQKIETGLTHFLIIEPTTGIPHEYILAYRVYEHSRGDFIKSKQFGEFNIEKRILKTNKSFQRDELVKFLPNQDTLEKPLGQ